jgi:hypothetical protein
MRRFVTYALLLLTIAVGQVCSATLAATMNVDASVTLNTFAPISIFGNNLMFWDNKNDVIATRPKLQAAGNFLIRFPGGSSSDDYHWNGNGAYDSKGWWACDDSVFQPGFQGRMTYRGTTSSYGTPSHLTDGNTATRWLSNVETELPNAQWVYVDLGSNKTANAVTLVWGDPYATAFTVQYWPTWSSNQWSPYSHGSNDWQNTTASNVVSSGGTQGVTFTAVTTRYLRVLMTASSAATAQYSIAELTVYNGVTQVSVNTSSITNNVPNQSWCVASSTDLANNLENITNFDFETYMDFMRSLNPPGIPMITVNYGTGTPVEAAAWVHYANVVKGYGIKYWQVGNETEGNWETGGPINTRDYVRRYIQFYDAMKAVDPTIIVTGPVAGGLMGSSNLYDGKTVTQDFISILHAQGKDAYIEALDFHWYPNWGGYSEAAALDSVNLMDNYPATIASWLSGVANASTIPVMMTEFNVDPGDQHFQVTLPNALFVSDALGRFIRGFGDRGFTNIWSALGGGSASTSLTGGSLGCIQTQNNAYQYQERPSYWAEWLMTNAWSRGGDAGTHVLASVSGAPSLLPSYATIRPDGLLSLMVINKDPSNSFAATLNLNGFTPNSTASGWRFDSTNYAWTTASLPYHASPDTAPTTFLQTGVSSSFPATFGPYSITVLQFSNALVPTGTPTQTPTITPTATSTATIVYGPVTLIDDFENAAREGVPPARLNLWGGQWGTSMDPGSSITVAYGPPGAGSTSRSARVFGLLGASAWSNFDTRLFGGWPFTGFDATGNGLMGYQFWFYGDGASYRVNAMSLGVTDFNYYGFDFTAPAGVWTFYQIPFATLTRQNGWGTQTGLPTNYTLANDFVGVQFKTQASSVTFDYRVDQVALFDATAGSPVPTATWTNTPTITRTPTITLTPTVTRTPTMTLSPTFTGSETATATASWTATVTETPTLTWSPTPTATPALPEGEVRLWPNPVREGDAVGLVLSLATQGAVRLRCYTPSYRLVSEGAWDVTGRETSLDWVLVDKGGKSLANGLYHVVVETPEGKKVLKLLVMR